MPSECLCTYTYLIFILILYDTAQAIPQSSWVRRTHSAFSRLCGHRTFVLFSSSWKDLLCFSWSKITNTAITPARLSFHRPHSTRQNTGCHHSQEITRQWSRLCQSPVVPLYSSAQWLVMALCRSWLRESLLLLCQVSFRLPTAPSWFQVWLRNQRTKLPLQLLLLA